MMYWGNGTEHMGWGVAMMVAMLVFWGLLAYLVVRALRDSSTAPVSGGAAQILAERLAHGDIDLEDYRIRLAAVTRVP